MPFAFCCLLFKSWDCDGDAAFALRFAKAVVRNKINNAANMLRERRRNQPDSIASAEVDALTELIGRAENAATLESLRGHEGAATAAYFKLFGKMLNPPWAFTTRTRRPPKDPVNAVLSFGYTIVANELQSLLDGIGFDPYAGFYHVAEYGRPSLALDLLEEFRHSLVDRLALHLFNQNVFAAADFQNVAAGGVHLNREGQKKFFRGYERYLGDYHGSPPGASVGHFRRHFKNQAYKLAKAIQEKSDYQPFDLSAPEAAAAETGDPPW